MTVLIADIGGTNVRFSLFDGQAPQNVQVMQVADYPSPTEAAQAYLAGKSKPDKAVFAVAGPVTGADVFELTNHPWKFSISGTRDALGVTRLDLINDFHALALGVLNAKESDITKLGDGTAVPNGNIGVIGPGTGLGVATLAWDGQKYIAIAGEGPHVTAPAVTQREFDLFSWLRQGRYSHVSAERVCSGKGLVNLYDAIRGVDHLDLPDATPAEITTRALEGSCAACAESVDIMLRMLGRIAGNLALTNMTRGGVYLAGGVLPKLGHDYIAKSHLREEFAAKGRFSDFMAEIPTFLIDDPYLALRGLGTYAMAMP